MLNSHKAGEIHISILIAFVALHSNINYYVYNSFDKIVFGPIHSRRLGVSLGMNLLPIDGKLCSFNCIYCECGLNENHRTRSKLPTRAEVKEALINKLSSMQAEGVAPDVITFAGNGEPTMHPEFADIIDDTIETRNRFPEG